MRALTVGLTLALALPPLAAQDGAAAPELPPRPAPIAEIMPIGTYHFANPGLDSFNLEADDVLAEKRQAEIARLVERLAGWKPDLVMLEFPRKRQADLDARFAKFRAGGLRDERNESVQLGMRLAAALDHARVAAVDVRYEFQAKEHAALYENPTPEIAALGQRMQSLGETGMRLMADRLQKSSVGDMLAWMNSAAMLTANHDLYVDVLALGWSGDNQGAAHTVANWYSRNVLIFQNVLREAKESAGKVRRAVVVIGQGHVPILRQLVRDTPWLEVADPIPFLREPGR